MDYRRSGARATRGDRTGVFGARANKRPGTGSETSEMIAMTRRRQAILLTAASGCALAVAATVSFATSARANDKLMELMKRNENWASYGRTYQEDNYRPMTQITAENVKKLKPAWSFSTGLLHGHEGTPLVVGGVMYVHTSFPNHTYALDLNDPGHILWQHKPKQDPAARSVACCDLVNRGLAYWPGNDKTGARILKTQLDGHVVALDAKTGEEVWKVENSDIKVGSTLTIAPYVVKDHVIIGSSGAELGVRGYVTAYDVKTGAREWKAYTAGRPSFHATAFAFAAS